MSLAELKPLRDGIVVKLIDHRPGSSIIVPVDPSFMRCTHECWGSKYKVRWGEAIATGPGRKDKKGILKPITVKVGDLVSFAGMTKAEDGEYVLIQEADVLVMENVAA